MRAASVSFCFTPDNAVYLNGYEKRRCLSEGVHQDLMATVLLLEDVEKTAIISFDLCGIDQDLIQRIAGFSNFSVDQLFVCATHTHASLNEFPLYLSFGQLAMRSPNENIRSELARQTAKALLEAEGELEEVIPYSKVAQAAGLYANRNDPSGLVDRFLNLLLFQTHDGRNKGCILHFNAHPTVLDYHNTLISPDFIGTTRNLMTAQFHCPITMINGACADVSTRFTRRDASIAECERIGTELYHRISDCTDLKKLDPTLSLKHRIYQAATCVYLPELKMDLSILELGELVLFGFPGEISVRFSREIKQRFDERRVLVCGYTNDYLGYFIDKEDARDTYEAKICTLQPEESTTFIEWLKATLTFL